MKGAQSLLRVGHGPFVRSAISRLGLRHHTHRARGEGEVSPNEVLPALARHALIWLLVGCGIGLLNGAMLLLPEINRWLEPLTYGRWMPIHHNVMLYGWCSLPLLALLVKFLIGEGERGRSYLGWIPWFWSAALLVGALSWLAGRSSGKLFLDWSDTALWAWIVSLCAVWSLIATGASRSGSLRLSPRGIAAWIVLAGLAGVPVLFAWVSRGSVYPVVNPASGGATGTSLLGSTLGVVLILLAAPLLLDLRPRGMGLIRLAWVGFVLHLACFALMDHGHVANDKWAQILGLGLLLGWVVILPRYAAQFDWRDGARRWMRAEFFWFAVLVLDGTIAFLPGVLQHWKFTHAMVAHAHMAMAGFWSAFAMRILIQMRTGVDEHRGFWLWNLGLIVHIAVLMAISGIEMQQLERLYRREAMIMWLFALRLLSGVAMTWAAWLWLSRSFPERKVP